jgi:DNA-binding NarL/FixJ family response regulator
VSASSPPRQRPTRRQLEVLRAYIAAGSIAAAAYELGISETTVRQHLSGLYRRTGCLNAAQAAYLLGRADRRDAGGSADAVIVHSTGEPDRRSSGIRV